MAEVRGEGKSDGMVFGRQSIGAGVLAMVLAGAGPAGGGQAAQQNAAQTTQQTVPNAPAPAIPDAPAPQTLPNLNTITPPAPLAPEPAPAATNPDAAAAADNGGITPTNKLPSAPAPGQQTGGEQAPLIQIGRASGRERV